MKYPHNLPDFRDELKKVRKNMEGSITAYDEDRDRLDELIDCLTEIIVDEMRN